MLLLAPALTCTPGMPQLVDCFNLSNAAGTLESFRLPKSLELCLTAEQKYHPVSKKLKTLFNQKYFPHHFLADVEGGESTPSTRHRNAADLQSQR